MYLPIKALSSVNLWVAKGLMLLSILASIFQSTTASAGTTVALSESYAGNMSFVLTGGSFRTTQNDTSACTFGTSSSNSLSDIPSGATIEVAYLYWAASGDGFNTDTTVTFNNTTVFADRSYTEDTGSWDFFSSAADVTNIVNTYGNSTYTLSDLDIYSTSSHCTSQTTLGGWALLVIYEQDDEDFRVLNLYEGFESFQNRQFSLIPNNFKLPSNPSGKHAHVTWEGDDTLGTDGEYLAFEGVILTDTGNPSNNQFNSYSNVQGGLTTYGVDIDEYDISAYLNEGDESVVTEYSAGQDLVLLSAEIISVSNIPVADLSVTTSTPTGWQANSTVTKKFTISNNGPNDVPTQSVRFTTTLPSELTFNGSQGDSDWVCNQSGQALSCVYQNKLRSGWSDYLDLTFDVGDVAGSNVTMSVSVDHNTAPYDIFDNQISNDTFDMTVPVSTLAVIDLSASSKVPNNLNGDLLLAGDTLQYTINIADASGLAVTGITVTDQLPSYITSYEVIEPIPGTLSISGNSLTVSNINLEAGTGENSTKQILIEAIISNTAPDGASLQNQATISHGSGDWIVDTGDITIVEPDLSASVKDADDTNGGWLLPNETVRYTFTLDDSQDLELTGLQITDHLPANISSFEVIESSLPDGAQDFSVDHGGNNSTGFIDIRNITLDAGSTLDIYVDVTVDSNAPDTADLTNTATVTLNTTTWDITSNELRVSLTTNTPASGNKPLYLVNSDLTRILPNTNTTLNFNHGDTLTWVIDNDLQDDLTLSAGNIRINLAVEGYRTGSRTSLLSTALYYNDNSGNGNVNISSEDIPYANYEINTIYDATVDLPLSSDITIPAGSSIYLTVLNTSDNNRVNQYGALDIHSINGSFYSAVILNSSTVINVDSISVWDSTFGDPTGSGEGNLLANSQPDTTLFIRAEISDPFGAFDINSAEINITKANGDPYDFSSHPDGNTNIMNQVDDASNDFTTNIKVFEKEITLLEDNEITGYWSISIKGYEGLEVAPDQVTHESVLSYKINPFLPNITLTKNITVINDPINGSINDGANPKAIPGAELLYTINAINSGRGQSDDGSLILQDEIPLNSDLYIGNITCPGANNIGPVCFQEGTSPNESGLSFSFGGIIDNSDDLFFSTDGNDFTYEPVDPGDGYDPAIRYIRMAPANALNNAPKDASAQPEFNFYYQIRLN